MDGVFVADIATTVHTLGEVITSRKIILERDVVYELGTHKRIQDGIKPVHNLEDLADISEMKCAYLCNIRTLNQVSNIIRERVSLKNK